MAGRNNESRGTISFRFQLIWLNVAHLKWTNKIRPMYYLAWLQRGRAHHHSCEEEDIGIQSFVQEG